MLNWFRRNTDPAPTTRRVAPPVRRAYAAANSDRIAGGFNLFAPSGREEIRRDIRGLVGHSRHASQNFAYARSYEMLARRHVIGPQGIRLKMDVRDPAGTRDLVACRAIETAWQRWGRMGSPTICGNLSWWGVECSAVTGIVRDGAALLRFHRGPRQGAFGFRVEVIPFDLLDLDYTLALSGGGYIESGVECDAGGRVLAFHFWNAPQDAGHIGARNRQRIRVPAKDCIMVTIPEAPAQLLNVPRGSTSLRLLNLIEKFQTSGLVAANYGAAQMIFFEQAAEGTDMTPAADMDMPDVAVEAGTTAWLPPGVKASPHAPHYPDAAVDPFTRHYTTATAAGYGVAAESLTGDLSRANFSSLRAGKGEERDEWRMVQRAVSEGLHGRVFTAWLEMALLSGQILFPSGAPLRMERFDKYNAATWQPRGWPSVNPKDDATANRSDLEAKLRTRTEICADRGRDFADVLAEMKAEEKAIRDAGLDPATFTAATAAALAAPSGDQEPGAAPADDPQD